jgi:hypothetical protein
VHFSATFYREPFLRLFRLPISISNFSGCCDVEKGFEPFTSHLWMLCNMLRRKKFMGITLGITAVAALLAILTKHSLAKPIQRLSLAERPPLHDVFDMMIQREDPATHMRRLSAGALPEFDLNRDGRISDVERARATAVIREQREAFSWYGEVFNELTSLPAAVFHTLLPQRSQDDAAPAN